MTEEEKVLDKKYQDGFKNAPNIGGWMPPCPKCDGEMEHFDYWLVTCAKCKDCGWSMSEGSGCLCND